MLVDKGTVVVERLRQSWLALSIVGMGAVAAVWWNQEVAHTVAVPVSVPRQTVPFPQDVPQQAALPVGPSIVIVDVRSVADLKSFFKERSYSLDTVRRNGAAVPRVLFAGVPGDLSQMNDVKERKAIFLQMMLPLVLRANERIEADRARLLEIKTHLDAGRPLDAPDEAWLALISKEYGADRGDIETLIARVDAIPPSLALAQAAVESGWGTSRFAREGNALFGQWTTEKGNGMVPAARDEGMSHRVRAFETPWEAVRSYMKNLNTHPAYRGLREGRSKMRRDGRPLNGMVLAANLKAYSEKGEQYVDLVRHIIQFNKLKNLNGAQLAPIRRAGTGV